MRLETKAELCELCELSCKLAGHSVDELQVLLFRHGQGLDPRRHTASSERQLQLRLQHLRQFLASALATLITATWENQEKNIDQLSREHDTIIQSFDIIQHLNLTKSYPISNLAIDINRRQNPIDINRFNVFLCLLTDSNLGAVLGGWVSARSISGIKIWMACLYASC